MYMYVQVKPPEIKIDGVETFRLEHRVSYFHRSHPNQGIICSSELSIDGFAGFKFMISPVGP